MNKAPAITRGFVALMVVLVMSVVLTAATVSLAQTGWYTRFMVLTAEDKITSQLLARDCIDRTIALLETDSAFTGSTTMSVGRGRCDIGVIDRGANLATSIVQVTATVGDTVTHLEATLNRDDIHLSLVPSNTERLGGEQPRLTISHIREVPGY